MESLATTPNATRLVEAEPRSSAGTAFPLRSAAFPCIGLSSKIKRVMDCLRVRQWEVSKDAIIQHSIIPSGNCKIVSNKEIKCPPSAAPLLLSDGPCTAPRSEAPAPAWRAARPLQVHTQHPST
jgi:hypothetical protein